MGIIRRSYRRIDRWTRNLSRAGYALLSAFVACLAVLGVGLLFPNESTLFAAVCGALGIGIVYYIANPQ